MRRTGMRISRVFLGFLAASLAAAAVSAVDRDPKADKVGKEMIAALGGEQAWEKAREFKFDFVVENEGKVAGKRSHTWDRYTGDYKMTGTDQSGAPYTVLFNVNTKQGKAWVNGRPVEGEEADKLVKGSYARFINDTYWLLAPWKVFDPGVNLAYEGEKPCPGGGTCDVLKLSFENVGLTPKDVYWMYVTRDGHNMVQWQYVLKGADEPPTTVQWKNWQKVGGIMIAMEKPMEGKPTVIRFENVSVTPTRNDADFQPPAP
ncbi:MAG TPA: hypothetical protein VKG01_14520 [Thermoanaerobaculia bacterium]|nr:hypothetical protein [Thermoanaerobaculia bacterium]